MKKINLQKVVSIKGKSGLYTLLSHNPKGFFVRPYHGGQTIFIANTRDKVLALGNVDLQCKEGSINMLEILRLIDSHSINLPEQQDKEQIVAYFQLIIPQLSVKVGHGHLTKVLNWYKQLFPSKDVIELENQEDKRLAVTS